MEANENTKNQQGGTLEIPLHNKKRPFALSGYEIDETNIINASLPAGVCR